MGFAIWTGAERLVPAHVARAIGFEWSLAWQRRRIRAALLCALVPIAVALLTIALQHAGLAVIRGVDLLAQIIAILYLFLLVAVLSLFAGTGLVAQEAEAKTLVYLLVRPLGRGSLITGKFIGAWMATSVLLIGSLVVTTGLLLAADAFENAGEWLARLPALAVCLVLGTLTYTALFTLAGLLFSRPAIVGLLFALGWENAIPFLPGWIKDLTVRHHLAALIPADALPSGVRAALSPPSAAAGLAWLCAGTVVALAISVWIFARRDYP